MYWRQTMTKYEWRIVDNEIESECDLCGSEAPLAEFETMRVPDRGTMQNICEVCASTHCGAILDHRFEGQAMARCIAQTANLILRKIGAF